MDNRLIIAEKNARSIETFKTKTVNERQDFLLKYWKIEEFIRSDNTFMLVGTYEKSERPDKNGQEYGYFVNIRNLNGDILYYPFGLGPVKVWVRHNPVLSTKEFWQFRLTMDKGKMAERNPFAIRLADNIFGQPKESFKDKVDKEKYIKYIFDNTGHTEIDAENEANALSRLMGDLYTETERFIFELLQNADDQPNTSNKVSTFLRLVNDQLLFMHNGKEFDKDDVKSISSIGSSTKKHDSEKIGYKGIGFKSVFSDSETVFINSGSFSFSFDRNSWFYRDVEDMDKVPWQIKPIWAERYRYPKAVQEDDRFFSSPVSFALTIPEEKIFDYSTLIPALLREPRFILFLRNVISIDFSQDGQNQIIIRKNVENGICNISVNDIKTNSWLTTDFVLNVDSDTRDLIQNDKLVPQKLKDVTKTKVSFAAMLKDGIVTPLPKEQSILFTYLPTKVDSFEFPFLINADFLTTASREDIHYKNNWNIFLFSNIGKKIVEWAILMADKTDGYLNLLPTKELVADEQESKYQLVCAFNSAYKDALESEAFIRDSDGKMRKQEEIIVDKSGLSSIVGHTVFCSIISTAKTLPNASLNIQVLSKKIFSKIERIDDSAVVEGIKKHTSLLASWMKTASSISLSSLYTWLINNIEISRPLINDLPIFSFGSDVYSFSEVKQKEDYLILNTKLVPVKSILSSLGFICSETIVDTHPLAGLVTQQSEKDIFSNIIKKDFSVLSFEQRRKLFSILKELDGVGPESLKGLSIFKNSKGILVPLGTMTAYGKDHPDWLSPYMVSEDESCDEAKEYTINKDSIYSEIINKEILNILSSTSLKNVYDTYSSSWQPAFTRSLFGKVSGKDIIDIVRQSDDETKLAFIRSITTLPLSSSISYSQDDYEYKVISLALSLETAIPLIRGSIELDGKSLSEYTIKDTVTLGPFNEKTQVFSLSKLDPSYTSSSKTDLLLQSLSGLPNVSKLLELKEKDKSEVMSQVLAYHDLNPGLLSSEQFCFIICYEKSYNRSYFHDLRKPHIQINDQTLFLEILQNCFERNIPEILSSFLCISGIEYPYDKLVGTFFDVDNYTLLNERAPEWIVSWANTKEKKAFLKAIGLCDATHNEIVRRKAFIEGTDEGIWDVRQVNTAERFLNWVFATESLPVTDTKKVDRLKPMLTRAKGAGSMTISFSMLNSSTEWDNEQYQTWKANKTVRIHLYDGEMPWEGHYPDNNSVLYIYPDRDYIFSQTRNILYLNKNKDITALLATVYSNHCSAFTKDDWNQLFLIKRADVKEISDENESLRKQNAELVRALEQYRALEIPEDKREVIEKGNVDKLSQERINQEVRVKVKPYLSAKGYDVAAWDPENSLPDIEGIIKDPNGNPINVVIRSAKQKKIHLSASSFETLMTNPNNLLIVENQSGLHCVTFTELFGNNSNVNLVFDAKFTRREYFQALGTIFKYVKNTEFVVWDPHYSSYNEIQGFGLDITNDGPIIIRTEEDI